ncbi:MAG: hypothetical protein K2M43_03660 [Mycoplasmoidaceae bacterium]|nr:hypothetical protein [Mycoplasmoidaceae bacterium]
MYAIRVKKNPQKSLVYELNKNQNQDFKLGSPEQQYPLTTKRKVIL